MSLVTMYAGKSNSPKTYLSEDITANATSITLADSSVLPEAPNIAVIGSNVSAEVILYSGKNGNILTGVVRGSGETTASFWPKDTVVARNFTLLDYKSICDNIRSLDSSKKDKNEKVKLNSDVSEILPIENGGTGVTTITALKTALGLAAMAYRSIINLISDVTGILPIVNGGSGLSASPSLLINLESTTATDIFVASPRPGVTGTLPVKQGGTGQTTLAGIRNALGLGNGTGALPPANGGTGQTSLQAARNAMGLGNTTGALPIANGGTGKTTAADARTNLGITAIAVRPDYTVSTTDLTPGSSSLASGKLYFYIGS